MKYTKKQSESGKKQRTIIAHRGMSAIAPENTLAAFSLASDYKVNWIECDVDILKDGTLIISHDETLDRCTDATGPLCEISKQDLPFIDAGSWFGDEFTSERLPTIEQLITLANHQQINLNIEIKSCSESASLSRQLIENLTDALKALSPERELIVSSFNFLVLSEFKHKNPDINVACLFESHTLLDDWPSIIEWCNAEYIHPEDKNLTREMVNKFIATGLKVNVWTVNDLARANELFNWGVDGVCTDIAHKFPSKYKT